MVNDSQKYRALESISIASALSSALTIYPCHIRVHQRWQSKLQLLTARNKEWWPATADSLPQAVTCQLWYTHYVSRHRTHNLPIISPMLPVGLPRPPKNASAMYMECAISAVSNDARLQLFRKLYAPKKESDPLKRSKHQIFAAYHLANGFFSRSY